VVRLFSYTSQEKSPERISWVAMITLLAARLAILSGFLILISFFLNPNTRSIEFYAFMAFAYIITIPYSLWMRNQERMRELAPLQFLADLILVSGLIYFTGGLHSDLTLLYPLVILSSGIILPLKQTLQITALSIVSYTLMVLLLSQNILVQYPSPEATMTLAEIGQATLIRIFIFIAFGVASAYVSRRCDYINRKEQQFRELTQVIFENVKTGLLLLDENDHILMANARACVLLGWNEADLLNKNLSSIRLSPNDLDDPAGELKGASDYFRRADGSVFPASLEDARITLPIEAVPHAAAPGGETMLNARIIDFTDLSHFLRLQKQIQQLERIKAAANMAKEMAHRVRTPLTAISGAIQLLQMNLKNSPPKEEAQAKDREDFCHQIVLESIRMDKVIQNFLDYAEFSPKDIRELLQMDIDKDFSFK